jgi:Tol biopolymer transport system component
MHLWRVSAHGGSPARAVPFTSGIIHDPAIAASGKRLAYVHESGITNIWRAAVTPNGKAGPPIQNASARASIVRPNAFSPDGQQMAFESDRSGPYGIWIANTDGSNAKFLFGSLVYPSGSPAWSSDGRWIAFDTKIDKQAAIYVISAAGTAPRRLTHSRADDMAPCWSRNGKWIYFVSDRTGSFEIFKISPEGGEEIQITHAGGFGPQESSDGKFLFYTRTRATSSPLLKMSAQGGPEAQILPSVHDRWWAVSDQGIWFMESTYNGSEPGFFEQENAVTDRGDLRFLNFESGAVTLASTIPKRPAGGIAISRDQRTLAFGQLDYRPTEIVLVENFR